MIYDKRPSISSFEKFLLTFVRSRFYTDHETGLTLHTKKLLGKTYVLAEITAEPDPLDEGPEQVYIPEKQSQEGT